MNKLTGHGSDLVIGIGGDTLFDEQIDNYQNHLSHALEQLSIHQEELRCQNEELIATQEALNRSHRLYQDLFERAPVVYILLNESGLITRINLRGESLLDEQRSRLINRPFERFLHPDDSNAFMSFLNLTGDTGQDCSLECRIIRKNGEELHVLLEATRTVAPDDAQQVIRLSLIDTTALWQTRSELEKSRNEAEKSSRAKSEFLEIMSHEVRTPLNAIIGVTSLLAESPLEAEQQELIRYSRRAADSLLSLLEDILDFSNIEAHRIKLQMIPFDLHILLQKSAEMYRALAERKGISLTLKIDPALPSVLSGAPQRICQVLSNLLSNAIKFTDQGAISLEAVRIVEPLSKQGKTGVCLMVRDSGAGIKPAMQQQIFDLFTQLDSSVTRRHEGIGLGLTICKYLVELMGGSITVVSLPDIGSTFSVRLFLDRTDQEPESSPCTGKNTQEPPVQRNFPLSVLLADDNEVNRIIQSRLLEKLGCKVTRVCNGVELVRKASCKRYDLILSDISMPVMDGIAATAEIRQLDDQELCNTPVVALTAHALPGDREKFMAAGMNDYLPKPVKIHELIELFDRLFPDIDKLRIIQSAPQLPTDLNNETDPENVLDRAYLEQNYLELGCQDLLADMAGMFCDSFGETIETLRRLLACGTIEDFAEEAHSLKGVTGTVGARRMYEVATVLTGNARTGKLDEIPQLIDSLVFEFSRYKAAIERYLEHL